MATHRAVALLRGINVGTAKRIAMADLRTIVESLGYTGVRTHLQSGNIVFDSDSPSGPSTARGIEDAVVSATGVSSRVIVVPEGLFRRIMDNNPLADSPDPSRMVITFLETVPDPITVPRPTDAELAPERLVIGPEAIYQWCPNGILKSTLPGTFFSGLGGVTTSRNLRTATKILQMLDA